MMRFKFRLQRVLNYREMLRKEKERELAHENLRLFEASQELDSIVRAQDEAEPEEEVFTMADVSLTESYQERLYVALEHQRELVEQAKEAVEDARNAYVEKAVEASILESLKERQFEEFKEERLRQERKQLNEFGVQAHLRRRRGDDS